MTLTSLLKSIEFALSRSIEGLSTEHLMEKIIEYTGPEYDLNIIPTKNNTNAIMNFIKTNIYKIVDTAINFHNRDQVENFIFNKYKTDMKTLVVLYVNNLLISWFTAIVNTAIDRMIRELEVKIERKESKSGRYIKPDGRITLVDPTYIDEDMTLLYREVSYSNKYIDVYFSAIGDKENVSIINKNINDDAINRMFYTVVKRDNIIKSKIDSVFINGLISIIQKVEKSRNSITIRDLYAYVYMKYSAILNMSLNLTITALKRLSK